MTRKIAFFEGWSGFKFNNLGLALGTNLKFCICVAKGLKLKVRKCWGPNPTFVEVTGKNWQGGLFAPPPPSWIGLMITIQAEKKILIIFDDMIPDIMDNKKFQAIIKELFIRCRKLNISLVFITQSYFSVPKDLRLNSTHYLIMKIK